MKKCAITVLVSLLTASLSFGCSKPSDTNGVKQDLTSLKTVSIPATSQIYITDKAEKITFVANSTAQWLGHIVYLTEDGQAYATNGEGVAPRKITEDSLADIYGITRDKAAGIILGLTQSGQIKAYVEASDDGSVFDPMIVSAPADIDIAGFCAGHSPLQGQRAWLRLRSGELATYAIEITDNTSLSIDVSAPIRNRTKAQTCGAASDHSVYVGSTSGMQSLQSNSDSQKFDWPIISSPTSINGIITGLALDTDQAVLVAQDETFKIQITDGLSIIGSSSLSTLAATAQSFGSTFGNGIIVASDNAEPRLILIAAPMFERQVEATLNK